VCAILSAGGVDADFYHGGRPHAARHDVHMRFLSGATPVIVATVAFGMGIDKPDIRRVVHYGAPKTVEEYYQQIGRAGRDGGPAECVLICKDSDFAAYSSDFYTAELSAHAREIVTASTERLRAFAADGRTCRWIKLLDHLGEGRSQPCGSCDNCRAKEEHKGDTERDFGPVARVLLSALGAGYNGQAWSHAEKAVAQHSLFSQLRPRRPTKVLKEFLPALEAAGLVLRKTVKGQHGAYDVYSTTPQGQQALRGLSGASPPPLMLPVPASVREEDRKAREAADRVKAEVEAARKGLAERGVNLAEVPEAELQPNAEQTPVTTAILHYYRQLKQWRDTGKAERAEAHEALHGSVVSWRAAEAKRVGMAPGAIFADHVAMKLVLVKPTSAEALKIAGARLSADGARALLELVAEWQQAHGSGSSQGLASQGGASSQGGAGSQQSAPGGGEAAEVLLLPDGVWTPAAAWALAPPPKPKAAAWEKSWQRFGSGQPVDAIAMTQESGKPIQSSTVVGHLFLALQAGRPLDLQRLAASSGASPPPTRDEWEQLVEAEARASIDVVRDEKLNKTALLVAFLPEAEKPFAERSPQDTALLSKWFGLVDWFTGLRRVALAPSFGPDPKRQRAA